MALIFVGAYWGPREETREACVQRLAVFFEILHKHDPALACWYERMMSPDQPLVRIPTDEAGLAPLLHVNQDEGGQLFPHLGMSFTAWRGPNSEAGASFTCSLGGYSRWVSNTFVIDCNDRTASPQMLRALLRATVEAFDPDDAIVNGGEMLEAANRAIREARAKGRTMMITDPPALMRYQRGRGYSENTPKHFDANPPIKPAAPPQI
jgi:hypothetical protein